MKRHAIAAAAALCLALLPLTGCSGASPFETASGEGSTEVTVAPIDDSGVEENPFIPTEQDLSDCVGTLPQPNCGSPDRGTRGAYLTMLALVLGVGFIAWRVSIGIRARDKVVNEGIVGDGADTGITGTGDPT